MVSVGKKKCLLVCRPYIVEKKKMHYLHEYIYIYGGLDGGIPNSVLKKIVLICDSISEISP